MASLAVVISLLIASPTQPDSGDAAVTPSTPPPVTRISTFLAQIDGLGQPGGVTFDPRDRLLVTDSEGGFIRVYDSGGQLAATWGRAGDGDGEFRQPRGIAVGPDGLVYVADAGNSRIQVLDDSGRMVRRWTGGSRSRAQLVTPVAVAVTATRVYVADIGRDWVWVFDLKGRFQTEFGGYGSAPGRLRRPLGIACDDDGRVYVADSDNCRVQRFSPDGAFETAWGQYGPFPGLLANPGGLCWYDGRLFVADTDNHRIQVFGPEGKLLDRWGVHALRPREGRGRLHYPSAIAVGPAPPSASAGATARPMAAVNEAFADRVQLFGRFDPNVPPDPLADAGLDLSLVSHYGPHGHIDGDLMVLTEPESHSIQVMEVSGREPILITRFGAYGGKAGQFVRPTGVAVDAESGSVFVCDAGNRRLQVFRLNRKRGEAARFDPLMARFVKMVDFTTIRPSLPGWPRDHIFEPAAIARDPAGNLFVLDTTAAAVCILTPALRVVRTWGGAGVSPGRFREPTDLAFSPDGAKLYVVDAGNGRIQSFDKMCHPLAELNPPRSDSAPARLFGVTVAADGAVLVSDVRRHAIHRFDAAGRHLKTWGRDGLGAGELHRPRGLFMDVAGRLVVIDHGNHRGAVFTAEGEFVDVFGAALFTQPARARPAAAQRGGDQ